MEPASPLLMEDEAMMGCIIAVLGMAAALAQEPSGLAAAVRVGQTVVVVDTAGRHTGGRVATVDDSAIVVDYGGANRRRFSIDEIDRVMRRRVWDGAIKGAAFGLIPAVLNLLPECVGCPRGGKFAAIVAVSAGIGVAIDVQNGPDTIYRRRRSGVRLQPMVSSIGAGVAATWRF
jgi:hypothetical protein